MSIYFKRVYIIHIPKTAGTAIRHTLLLRKQNRGGHVPYEACKRKAKNRTVFAVIRCPYDRLLSNYHYARLEQSHYHKKGTKTEHPLRKEFSSITFEQMVDRMYAHYLSGRGVMRYNVTGFLPQSFFVCDSAGDIAVDNLLRHETLQQDLDTFLSREGLPTQELKTMNVSRERHGSDSLSPEYKAKIREMYSMDFKNFPHYDK